MEQQLFYRMEVEEVLSYLHTSHQGLTPEERANALSLYGSNILKKTQKKSQLLMLMGQLKDPMVILLVCSALLARFLQDVRTAIILIVIVAFNTVIGFFQEAKAEREMESLKKLVGSKAKVKIAGELKEIDAKYLVPGDIVFLEAGDAVPADLRVLEESGLQTNDFSLTGESNPKKKHIHKIDDFAELGDRTNLVFLGTTVATGRARGIVIGTGMDTELGKIASLTSDVQPSFSPMQLEMANVAKRLTMGTLFLCVILLIVVLLLHFSVKEALLFALGIAAAMVPQGLPAQITITLTSAAIALAKKNALIKKISSVETLGAVQVICTDKTGTLTKNEMTVMEVMMGRELYTTSGSGYETNGEVLDATGKKLLRSEASDLFFSIGALASNAHVQAPDDQHATWYVIGDPTEGALITLARKYGLDEKLLDEQIPLCKEFSFDSGRKRMSCIRRLPDGKYRLYIKGSAQTMLERASGFFDGKNVLPLTPKINQFIEDQDERWAKQALRVLCYGYKDLDMKDFGTQPIDRESLKWEDIEKEYTILGLVAMIDPPRDEVAAAITAAYHADIKVFVVTGDHALTAQAIAERIGLDQAGKIQIEVIQGEDLRTLSDVKIIQKLASGHAMIFSRVSPEDKVRIVKLCKRMGLLVAVTGDGVNDAPALKNADIGVAMGKTGTDVAKDAAEIVLLDDSFATLVVAIQKGRVIYQNIKKIVLSCITTNLTELTIVLLSLLFGALFDRPLALLAVQILAIDLMGEMFALAALARDPPMSDVLSNKPRDLKSHILDRAGIKDLIASGSFMGVLAFATFYLYFVIHGLSIGDVLGTPAARSVVYCSVVIAQYMNIFSRRSGTMPFFTPYLRSNKKLLICMGIGLVCITAFVYSPFCHTYFGTGSMTGIDWLLAVGVGVIYLIFREWRRKHRPTRY